MATPERFKIDFAPGGRRPSRKGRVYVVPLLESIKTQERGRRLSPNPKKLDRNGFDNPDAA